ncbi:MAG: class I tRNA ligase family protein, partial [Gemmatimonadetes bacterium]|nr:class I tRNA ligase family protein [Gemmatimonadota bacterium]
MASLGGTAHAVATTSATTALELTLAAHDIGPGDEVVAAEGAREERPRAASPRLTLAAEDRPLDAEVERKLHATIQKVTEDLEALSYNTAIAAMMEYLNFLRAGGRMAERSAVEPLVLLVAPFAPHLAEELWERMGKDGSIFDGGAWPSYDPAKALADTIEL